MNDLTDEKKSFYAIVHFEGYATTWWEYVKYFGDVLIKGQPPSWFQLRYMMMQKYLPKSYQD